MIYMCDGWDTARGCTLEHQAALAFGIDIKKIEGQTNG